MRIRDFEWNNGNVLHLALRHGIEPEEAEEVFAFAPLIRRTERGHYAAFGPTDSGRLLMIVFARKEGEIARVITGWDMDEVERRYYQRRKKGCGLSDGEEDGEGQRNAGGVLRSAGRVAGNCSRSC